jgi:hypothetical protein
MRGPSDLSDILSGLKTKTISIKEAVSSEGGAGSQRGGGGFSFLEQPQMAQSMPRGTSETRSSISLQDLKELSQDGGDAVEVQPKKPKRRTKSDKNTLSLDI